MAELNSNVKDQLNSGELALVSKVANAEKELLAKQESLATYLKEVKDAEDNVKKLRESLVPILKKTVCYDERGKEVAPFVQNDFVRFTLVRGFSKEVLDADALSIVEPKLYKELLEKYHKPSSRKDTVRMSFLKVKVESE